MSLIQEALRRRAEETDRPQAPAPRPTPRRTRTGLVVALAAALLLGAGWLVLRLYPPRGTSLVEPPAAVEEGGAPAPRVERENDDAAMQEPIVEPDEPAADIPVVPIPEEPQAAPEPPSEAIEAVAPEPAAPIPEEPPVASAPAPPEAAWPSLKLLGVMLSTGMDSPSSALLNEDMVEEGETLGGVRLVEVGAAGVWLEYRGEKRYLKVGQRLP